MKIIIFICLICIICGCQSTTRFISSDNTKKNLSTNVDNNKQNIKNVDTSHYSSAAKIIHPPDITSKYSTNVVSIAEKWIGTPYLYGGNTKVGIDCSGFVKNVYQELGVNLPRTSAQQYKSLKPTNTPAVGDLIFFKKGNVVNHVGIFIGDGKMIHSSSKKGVIIQPIPGSTMERKIAGYRKVF